MPPDTQESYKPIVLLTSAVFTSAYDHAPYLSN